MIKISINKKFNGLYPIRDKYTKQAEKESDCIEITVKDTKEKIVIPKEHLNDWIAFTKGGFKDNFSNEVHSLVYYKIKKDNNNLKLI